MRNSIVYICILGMLFATAISIYQCHLAKSVDSNATDISDHVKSICAGDIVMIDEMKRMNYEYSKLRVDMEKLSIRLFLMENWVYNISRRSDIMKNKTEAEGAQ